MAQANGSTIARTTLPTSTDNEIPIGKTPKSCLLVEKNTGAVPLMASLVVVAPSPSSLAQSL